MADNQTTYESSELAAFFRAYFIFHKQCPNVKLDTTSITLAFFSALGGLDTNYSSKEFIMSIKSDFDTISRVLERLANQAYKDIRSNEGIRDKQAETDYYTVPEIETRWNISGTAVRKAIKEQRLKAKEVEGRKSKYHILREDFEEYARNNAIKLKES